jgi:hypothetical protein
MTDQWTPPPPPPPYADELAAVPSGTTVAVGDLVSRTYFDPYSGAGGRDVTVRGIVVAVETDTAGGQLAAVAILATSDPVPAGELTVL